MLIVTKNFPSAQTASMHTQRTHFFTLVLLAFALLLPLSACGKKPSVVDPPPEVVEDHFPRSYPDASTDPAATVPPAAPPKTKAAPPAQRYPYF